MTTALVASAAWGQGDADETRISFGLDAASAERLETALSARTRFAVRVQVVEPSAELPDPTSFDLLVAWPTGQAFEALDRRFVVSVDRSPFVQLGARPYALRDGRGELGPWDRLVRHAIDGNLALPDPFAEPGFLDALAAWGSRQAESRIEELLRSVTFRSRSAELRAEGVRAVVAMLPGESPPERLPGVQLVVAVSRAAPNRPRATRVALEIAALRSAWWPTSWGQEAWIARPSEIARMRARLTGPGPAGRELGVDDWVDTLLLAVFGLGFGWIVLRAARRAPRRARSSRP